MTEDRSCNEMVAELRQLWDTLREDEQWYRTRSLVRAGCQEVVPLLARHLNAEDPFHRSEALYGLALLGRREYRQAFIKMFLTDPNPEVRQVALRELGIGLFRDERDREILDLALSAFDNPLSTAAMRLTAAAVMAFQLGLEHESPRPPWWNEEEEDLRHPWTLHAVEETRRLLARENGEDSDARP